MSTDNATTKTHGAESASTAGLGIWTRPRPLMFQLCTLDIYQSDRPLNKGVWEIIGFEDTDTDQEVFVLRRFSPAEPSGQTGEMFKFWRRGPDLLDPRFLTPNGGVNRRR